jgi:chorismate-pyruvate lyase
MNHLRQVWRFLLGVCLFAVAARTQLQSGLAVERLRSDLLAGASATQVLTQYCAKLKLASPPIIHAVRDQATEPAPAEVRALLKARADETVRYRRVQLMCGDHVLSVANNWYLPSRLTPEMNTMLDETDTPFGTVVRPLGFHRKTLEATAMNSPTTILRVRALLLTSSDAPFSLVVENYGPDLVTGGHSK